LLNTRLRVVRNQSCIGICLLVVCVWLAGQIRRKIGIVDLKLLAFLALGIAGFSTALIILRDWRLGFYFFMVWLLFDFRFRKFRCNIMALLFDTDIIADLTFISLCVDVRGGKKKLFSPPFLLSLLLLIWLAVIQVFNTNSPHVLYGVLGMKVYFFYIPLLYVCCSTVHNDAEPWAHSRTDSIFDACAADRGGFSF
jgi:hypothetical protein